MATYFRLFVLVARCSPAMSQCSISVWLVPKSWGQPFLSIESLVFRDGFATNNGGTNYLQCNTSHYIHYLECPTIQIDISVCDNIFNKNVPLIFAWVTLVTGRTHFFLNTFTSSWLGRNNHRTRLKCSMWKSIGTDRISFSNNGKIWFPREAASISENRWPSSLYRYSLHRTWRRNGSSPSAFIKWAQWFVLYNLHERVFAVYDIHSAFFTID